jgi:hypothetical protein
MSRFEHVDCIIRPRLASRMARLGLAPRDAIGGIGGCNSNCLRAKRARARTR